MFTISNKRIREKFINNKKYPILCRETLLCKEGSLSLVFFINFLSTIRLFFKYFLKDYFILYEENNYKVGILIVI